MRRVLRLIFATLVLKFNIVGCTLFREEETLLVRTLIVCLFKHRLKCDVVFASLSKSRMLTNNLAARRIEAEKKIRPSLQIIFLHVLVIH